MKNLIIRQFTCLTLLLNSVILIAQQVPVKRAITDYQAHEQSTSGLMMMQQSGSIPGGYILKPDNEGQLDFDTTLANNLQRVTENLREKYDFKGISAAALIPGKGMWLGVSGYSTLEPPDTVSPEMIFNLNIIHESFVSALMLSLAEEGLVSLDDSIGTYLTDLPETISGQITIRQLLNHMSGLYDYLNDPFPATMDSLLADLDHLWTFEEILEKFMGPPHEEPGVMFSWSGTDYFLANEIIRRVTDTTISAQLHQRFLDSLSLERTFFPPDDELIEPVAHPWGKSYPSDIEAKDLWSVISSKAWQSFMSGSGGMFATAEDLTRFVYDLLSGQILTQASLDQIQSCIFPWGPTYGIGLGCIYREKLLGKIVWDYGGAGWSSGYSAMVFYYPPSGFTYAVLIPDCLNTLYEHSYLFFNEYLKSLPVASDAQPGVLYALSSTNDGLLCTASTTTLDLSTLRPVLFTMPYRIKMHPVTGDLWGLFYNSNIGWQLANFDGVTGEAFPRVEISIPEAGSFTGMDFDSDGTLYLASSDGKIYTVDTASGDGTLLVTSPLTIKCMAIQPGTGEMWATAKMGQSRNPRIFKISLQNGDTLGIGNAGLDQLLSDIAFDAQGKLFGVIKDIPSRLIYIDASTGKGIEIKTFDTTEIMSIAFSSGAVIDIPSNLAKDQQDRLELDQNYPNPFSNSTDINFRISDKDYVSLKIFNIDGQEVATIINGELRPGSYKVTWDAGNFPGGIYFYRLEAGSIVESRKLVLLR